MLNLIALSRQSLRSERRLCEEVHLNLAYRWFCHLSLSDKVPDHSTFSKNRHDRFRDSDAFRQLFESVLRRCMLEGLVQGEGFATDASIVKADAQRQRAIPGTRSFDWSEAAKTSRPIREYLAALEVAAAPVALPKSISLTDPAATWTAVGGPAIFAYSTNYLVDLKAGIIVDVEASSANKAAEVNATMKMLGRVEQIFALKPARLVGDTNCGSAAMLGWLIDEKKLFLMYPYLINLNGMTVPLAVPALSLISTTIGTSARLENRSGQHGVVTRKILIDIAPACMTLKSARSTSMLSGYGDSQNRP